MFDGIFDLYEPNFPKLPKITYFKNTFVRPIFSTKSMHTDFVVQAKCTILWLNRGVRVYCPKFKNHFQNTHCCIAPKAKILKNLALANQNVP